MSLYLKSRKYRWMAILTLLATIVYVFAVDLIQLDPIFRIISFLVLGVALIGLSIVYSRRRSTESGE
jgi:uncharacterized membrane protein